MWACVVLLGEELADLCGSCGGSLRTGLGGLDDSREMEHFFALEEIST
jgi:hypothetical protein